MGGNHSVAPSHASVITYGANTRSVSQRGVHGIQLRTTMERGDRVRRSLHGVGVVVSVEHQSARADDGSNVNRFGIDVVVLMCTPTAVGLGVPRRVSTSAGTIEGPPGPRDLRG